MVHWLFFDGSHRLLRETLALPSYVHCLVRCYCVPALYVVRMNHFATVLTKIHSAQILSKSIYFTNYAIKYENNYGNDLIILTKHVT